MILRFILDHLKKYHRSLSKCLCENNFHNFSTVYADRHAYRACTRYGCGKQVIVENANRSIHGTNEHGYVPINKKWKRPSNYETDHGMKSSLVVK